MRDEIEDLIALADECRSWMHQHEGYAVPRVSETRDEFARLADKLNAIAGRITEKDAMNDPEDTP